LENNDIGEAGAYGLAKNTKIIVLNLSRNRIGNAGAYALARNRALNALFLNDNGIGSIGAKALGAIQCLHTLVMTGNPLCDVPLTRGSEDATTRRIDAAETLIATGRFVLLDVRDCGIPEAEKDYLHKRWCDTPGPQDVERKFLL
jgi:hypothetical protein